MHHSFTFDKSQTAFTLIECIIVFMLIAIGMMFVASTYASSQARQRLNNTLSTLQQTIQFAKLSSRQLRTPIILCASQDGKHCGENWSQGAIVFTSPQNQTAVASQNKRLKIISALKQGDILIFKGFAKTNRLIFMPERSQQALTGSFYFCSGNPFFKQGFRLVINRIGRVRIEMLTRSHCAT